MGITAPLIWKVLGSATWSAGSLMGRESRVERKDLAKESSVILEMVLGCGVGYSLDGISWDGQGR